MQEKGCKLRFPDEICPRAHLGYSFATLAERVAQRQSVGPGKGKTTRMDQLVFPIGKEIDRLDVRVR